MKSSFKPLLLLTCLFLTAFAGQIHPQDISIVPNNKNTPSVITFIFMPETSLATSDYLKIVLPFKLNSNSLAAWNIYSSCTTTPIGSSDKAATITASTIATDTNAYFVKFYTDSSAATLSTLTGNITYYLKISGVPDSSAQTGINNPVQLYTVSSNANNAIIYDYNPVFGTLTLNDPYQTTMTVSISIPSTQSNVKVLGNMYYINVDLTPTITLYNRARIDIILTNSAFSLLSCVSVSSSTEKINALAATYTVLNTYSIRATIAQTVTATNLAKYRFYCKVQNPSLAGTSRVSVQNRMGYVESITEAGTDTVGIQAATTAYASPAVGSASGWSESNHKVLLGWGYEASSPTALGLFGIYKDANTVEPWYQSVKTIFQPANDMTSTAILQVVVSTVNDAGFYVLAASIFHNLPDYSATQKVTCNSATQGYLICKNVGQLQGRSYFISFRFGLISTATISTVSDFGKVSVQTQATSTIILALSQTTLTNKAIITNAALFTSSQANGVIAYSSPATGGTAATYVNNNQDISLNFAFNYFTSNIVPVSTSQINRGIEFYTTPSLPTPSTATTCTIATLSGSQVTITDCTVAQSTTFTRLRFRIATFGTTGSPVSTLFQSSYQTGTISFNKVNFGTVFSSLNYVSASSTDYYVRWVQNFAASNPTITQATGSTSFFFNSLVYSSGALANMQVGTSLFVTSASTGGTGNTGTSFPTLIRVTGTLAAAEQSSTLLLFFNDLTPFDPNNPCFSLTTVSCTYSANAVDRTATDQLTDYAGSRVIAITPSSVSSTINIYIPVITSPGKTSVGFFLAMATSVTNALSTSIAYSTTYSKRFAQRTSSATTLTVNAATASTTPKLVPPASTPIGSVADSQISVTSGYTVPSPNTAALIGAAYGYCANYDFTPGTGFRFQSFPDTTATCVPMTYPVSGSYMTCVMCPVASSMTTGLLTAAKFTMSTLTGVDIYNNVYVVGTNNGDFYNAAYDSQATKLASLTMTGVSLTFSPSSFKNSAVNTLATLSFTTTVILPPTIKIDIKPSSPSTSLYMNAVTGFTCTSTNLTLTSCTVAGSTTDLYMTATTSGTSWSPGYHNINFLVNADSSATALSSNTIINYMAYIYVTGTTNLGAVEFTSAAQTFTVVNAVASTIYLGNATYYFGNKNARTLISFTLQLPSDVIVSAGQTIVFNLGGIATANVGQVPNCMVYNYLTSAPSTDFASCTVSDLTQLTLSPKVSASGTYTIVLDFLRVPSSAAPASISAKVVAVDGATIVTQTSIASTFALPTAAASVLTPATNVALTRLYSNPGSVAVVVLSIAPSVLPITQTSFLYMYFPTYYSNDLGYENIWCTAGDLPVTCFVTGPRLIQLTSFPVTIPVGTTVQIKIYGIITPVVPTPVGTVFIGLDNNSDMFTLTEQIEVNDVASNSGIPSTLYVDSYTLSTYKIRESADHTLSFTTDAIGVRASKILAFDFPDLYGGILGGQTGPIINIAQTGSTTVTSVQSVSIGSRFWITLPLNLNPLTSYTFVLQAIDNPEQPICNMDRLMITVTDSTQAAAAYRTAPNVWNVPSVTFTADSTQKTLNWADVNGNILTSVPLTIGVYSQIIRIIPPTGSNFIEDVTFSSSDPTLTILASTLIATSGSPYLEFRVGAPITAVPQIILFRFSKEETSATTLYSELPKLQLILTNSINTLPVSSLRIVQGGTSLPYQWDLASLNLIPQSELKIQASINSPTLSPLTVVGATGISFGPSQPLQSFSFDLAGTAVATSPPSFVLSLSGEDSPNYQFLITTVVVQVLTPPAAAPVLSSISITGSTATKESFAFYVDQPTSVFWHVAFQGQIITDCLRVRAKYNQGFTYDSSSAIQAQYGVFYVYNETILNTYLVSNLLSNTTYSYILCPSNQLSQMGSSIQGTFTTINNLASQYKVTLQFSQAITRAQLTSIICLFNSQLQLPNLNVVAMDGTSCSKSSTFSSFSSFDYKNPTIFINGNEASDYTSTVGTTLYQDIIDINNPLSNSTFRTNFIQTLKIAGVNSYYLAITITPNTPSRSPVIDTTSLISSTSDYQTINVTGFKLSSGNGIFYGIATTDTTTVPTQAQIIAGLDGTGSSVSSGNVIYGGGAVQISFTGLTPVTTYMIYYYAANDDRTQYAAVTSVSYTTKTTRSAPVAVSALKMKMGFVTMLIALIAGLLL